MSFLTEHEHQLFADLRDLTLPVGVFTEPGTPNLPMGTVPLVDWPSFRAYLITAHGRRELMVASKGTDDARQGHTSRASATDHTDDECRRVAIGYGLELGRRVSEGA